MRTPENVEDPPAAWECPYCQSHRQILPIPGERIIVLAGFLAGQTGTVVQERYWWTRDKQFLAKMDFEEREDVTYTFSVDRDRVLPISQCIVPEWMPELSIEDNAAIHSSIISNIRSLLLADTKSEVADGLYGIVSCIWWGRFPLSGKEIWPALSMHGVQKKLRNDVIGLVDFGLHLLRSTQGRAAVKRKRMPAMSQGRYHSDRRAKQPVNSKSSQ